VNFSPKGERLVTSGHKNDRTVRIWDIASEKELVVFKEHEAEVPYAEFSPDGARVVSAGCDNSVRIWEAGTGKEIAVFKDRFRSPFCCSARFSKDGKRIACSAKHDIRVLVWNVETRELVHELETPNLRVDQVAYDPDCRWIAATCATDISPAVRLWNADTGKQVLALPHSMNVWCLAFSPDGKRLATGSFDKRVRIWNTETGQDLTPGNREAKVGAVAISPDGKTLASSAVEAGTPIRLWDLATGKPLPSLPVQRQPQTSLAFSPDGKILVAASANSGAITFWDWATGKEAGALPDQGQIVSQLAYSPNGQFLAFRTATGQTKLWEVAAKKLLTIDPGGPPEDGRVAFSPNSKTLASGGSDKVLHLWDVATGAKVADLGRHEDSILWAGFCPDGTSVAFWGGPRTDSSATGGLRRSGKSWPCVGTPPVWRGAPGERTGNCWCPPVFGTAS